MKVKIGVTFRTDGRGDAHSKHDCAAINSINLLKNDKGEPLFPFTVEAVTLPKGVSGSETPIHDASWTDLDGIDMLYIPGGPYANDTQVATSAESSTEYLKEKNFNRVNPSPTKASDIRKHKEHQFRSQFELKMIGYARQRGIPILAVCAGSWRLLEAYGGKVRTMELNERAIHHNPKNPWSISHAVKLLGGKMLTQLMHNNGVSPSDLAKVNSTHWAVAVTRAHLLESRDKDTTEVSRHLEISAVCQDTKTVEAFESLYGTPVLGIQWHPESYLPTMLGLPATPTDEAYQTAMKSQAIFSFMVWAAYVRQIGVQSVADEVRKEHAAYQHLKTAKGLYTNKDYDKGRTVIKQAEITLRPDTWTPRMKRLHQELLKLEEAPN